MKQPPPRFYADVNVGKLARWLRILGYDVAYSGHIEDRALAQRSRQEGRIILTTDGRLPVEQKTAYAVVLPSFDPWEQLNYILDTYPLDPEQQRPFTRCSHCNALLEAVAKEDYRERIPPRSYDFYNHFYRCTGCDKLYWPGTHVTRMLRKFKSLPE